MTLQSGDTILDGKYHILQLIGEGAFARVWLAEEPAFGGRRVAIKEPRTAQLDEQDRQELERRFRQETALAPQMEQAGVTHVVRAYTLERLPDGAQLLVMEYVEGGSLAELMADHPDGLPVERAVAIALDVLRALEGFHSLAVMPVHRDVKPENVLLDGQGRARLSDFGLAQLPGASGRSKLAAGPHPGTPLYMAPEQGRSPDPLTPAADLYAVGCVLWEMLTGKRYKRVRPGTKAGELRSDVPGWLDDVLAKALAEDPWDRYPSAGEMAAALAAPPVGARVTRARVAAKRPPWLVPALVAGLAATALIVAVLWLGSRGGEPGVAATATAQARLRATQTAQAVARAPTDTPTATSLPPTATDTPTPTPTPVPPTDTPRPPTHTPVPPTPTPAPPAAGATQVRDKDGMVMVYVPAGEFTMGSDDADVDYALQLCNQYSSDCKREWFEDEQPAHTVYLDAFWIDRTEVTNEQFGRFVQATGYRTNAEKQRTGWANTGSRWEEVTGADWQHPNGPSTDIAGRADHSVVQVSWNDAKAYCQWAGGRLPMEAEWEKAARGTDGRIYPWGNTFDGSRVSFCDRNCEFDWKDTKTDDGYARTAPVGSYPAGASPYGALDMVGNVWEWVADWYDSSYYDRSPSRNPQGPGSGDSKVLRGSSWNNAPDYVRCASRHGFLPGGTRNNVGFRCARGSP